MTANKSKQDLYFLLDQAAWPALLVDAGGTIRKANQAAIALFGSALETESSSLSALLAGEGQETNAELFLAAWERSAQPWQMLKFRGKGGAVVPFHTGICAWNREGEKRFLFQLQRELPAAPGKAGGIDPGVAHKQKLDCAMQLARTVALDFNNALTSILGYTSLVLARMELDHPLRHTLLQVEKSAEKAAEIAQQLATFTRPERDNSGLAPANLNTVLRRAVDTFRQTSASGIEWQLELAQQLYATRLDEAKVQQAFIKVLENAIEAVGDSGRITIRSANVTLDQPLHDRTASLEPGSYVAVDIEDTGSGIDPDVLPRIFEPFFTTKPNHRGLGLAWVYGIITNHRGGVTVSSQLAGGTQVRVYLPADRRMVREQGGQPAAPSGHQTILFVDDEEALLGLGQTILTTYGYQVLLANSGMKALEILRARRPEISLVITDFVMPQMSGRELIEKIKVIAPDLPVLCTSGYVRPSRSEEHERFLAKPYTSQELVSRVKQLLGQAK